MRICLLRPSLNWWRPGSLPLPSIVTLDYGAVQNIGWGCGRGWIMICGSTQPMHTLLSSSRCQRQLAGLRRIPFALSPVGRESLSLPARITPRGSGGDAMRYPAVEGLGGRCGRLGWGWWSEGGPMAMQAGGGRRRIGAGWGQVAGCPAGASGQQAGRPQGMRGALL